jgi:hypothetical protein
MVAAFIDMFARSSGSESKRFTPATARKLGKLRVIFKVNEMLDSLSRMRADKKKHAAYNFNGHKSNEKIIPAFLLLL